jgi:hypothetical protein
MNKFIKISALCLLLSGCGDNPFGDFEEIKDTDYAQIRLEMERCSHIVSEGSLYARLSWSPKTDCLKHLKYRIIHTGNAKSAPFDV